MAFYLISYDQHKDRDYTPVWSLLKQWNAARILESVWFVDSSQTTASLRDNLMEKTRKEAAASRRFLRAPRRRS